MTDSAPVKDPDEQAPVPTAWRGVLTEVVQAFVEGDFALSRQIDSVRSVDTKTAEQIREYLDDYGETLCALPKECWETSVVQWYEAYWDVLVDLWTEESGPSDLVLQLRVYEAEPGYSFQVQLVYVP